MWKVLQESIQSPVIGYYVLDSVVRDKRQQLEAAHDGQNGKIELEYKLEEDGSTGPE